MAANGRSKRKAAPPAFARLVAADELGLLKVIEVPAGPAWDAAKVVNVWGQPNSNQSIHALAATHYMADIQGPDCLAVSHPGGSIQVLNPQSGQVVSSFSMASVSSSDVKCLAFRQGVNQQTSLVACSTSGLLHCYTRGSSSDNSPQAAATWQPQGSGVQTAPNVACMALDPSQTHVAVGGDGCQLQVWRLGAEGGSAEQVFKAKGAKPNKVGNVDLPHITAATFLPDPSGQQVLVGTAKHKLWLYDMRAGQRPQLDISWGESRITSLAPQHDGSKVWVASGTGHIEALDFKMKKMQGSMKGAAGSVRSLVVHPDAEQPFLAVAGLDRFARVYHTGTRHSQCKVYCKQQLTGIAWLRPLQTVGDEVEAEQEEADEVGQHAEATETPVKEEQQKLNSKKSKSKSKKHKSDS